MAIFISAPWSIVRMRIMDIARMQTPGWPCGGDQLTVHALWRARPTTANYFARLRTITCVYASTLVNGVRSRKPRCTEGREPARSLIARPWPPSTTAFRMPSRCATRHCSWPRRRCQKFLAAAKIVPVGPQSRSSHRLDDELNRYRGSLIHLQPYSVRR